jgi:hypothetical protein
MLFCRIAAFARAICPRDDRENHNSDEAAELGRDLPHILVVLWEQRVIDASDVCTDHREHTLDFTATFCPAWAYSVHTCLLGRGRVAVLKIAFHRQHS